MFVDNVLYVNICRIHIDIEKKKGARKEAAFYNKMAKLTAKISVVAVGCWSSPCLKGFEESKGIFRFFKGRLNKD